VLSDEDRQKTNEDLNRTMLELLRISTVKTHRARHQIMEPRSQSIFNQDGERFMRLLGNTHLLRYPHPMLLRRNGMFAAFPRNSEAFIRAFPIRLRYIRFSGSRPGNTGESE
jgi:hypothetical protein